MKILLAVNLQKACSLPGTRIVLNADLHYSHELNNTNFHGKWTQLCMLPCFGRVVDFNSSAVMLWFVLPLD